MPEQPAQLLAAEDLALGTQRRSWCRQRTVGPRPVCLAARRAVDAAHGGAERDQGQAHPEGQGRPIRLYFKLSRAKLYGFQFLME